MDSGTKMSSLAVTSLDIFNTVVILIFIQYEVKLEQQKKIKKYEKWSKIREIAFQK